jgi:hypothetical protein
MLALEISGVIKGEVRNLPSWLCYAVQRLHNSPLALTAVVFSLAPCHAPKMCFSPPSATPGPPPAPGATKMNGIGHQHHQIHIF